MNGEVKRKWVEALNSDKYKQGDGLLRSTSDDGNDYYCCLGVLCDLAVEAGVAEWHDDDGDWRCGTSAEFAGGMSREDFLPLSVMQWAGLDINDPNVTIVHKGDDYISTEVDHPSLSALNDTGSTFSVIAGHISKFSEV